MKKLIILATAAMMSATMAIAGNGKSCCKEGETCSATCKEMCEKYGCSEGKCSKACKKACKAEGNTDCKKGKCCRGKKADA